MAKYEIRLNATKELVVGFDDYDKASKALSLSAGTCYLDYTDEGICELELMRAINTNRHPVARADIQEVFGSDISEYQFCAQLDNNRQVGAMA